MASEGFADWVRRTAAARHPGNGHVAAEIETMLAEFGDDPASVVAPQALRAFSAYSPMAGNDPLVSVIFCRAAALRLALDFRDGVRPFPAAASGPTPGKTAVFRFAMPFTVGADGRGTVRRWFGTATIRTVSPDDARPALSLRTPEGRIALRRMGTQWLRPVLAPDTWQPMASGDLMAAAASPPPWNDNPFVVGPRGRSPVFGLSEVPVVGTGNDAVQTARATRKATAIAGKVGPLYDVDGLAYRRVTAPRVGVAMVGSDRVPAWTVGDLVSFHAMAVRPTAPGPHARWEPFDDGIRGPRDTHTLPCSLAPCLPALWGGADPMPRRRPADATEDLVVFDDPDLLLEMQGEALETAAEWLRPDPGGPDVSNAAVATLREAAALHGRGLHREAGDMVSATRLPNADRTKPSSRSRFPEALASAVVSAHGQVLQRVLGDAADAEELSGFAP